MEPIKVVSDAGPDPKAGKKRATSGVSFPYFDLDSCIEVAGVIYNRAGGQCTMDQLASLLNYSGVSNGAFRSRISATKMFGLIAETDDRGFKVTKRGIAIVAPVAEQDALSARVAAFLDVDLFRKVYDLYNGGNLPNEAGLRNLLATQYKVVPVRINPTVRILLDSAEQAGFFSVAGNRTRMVKPLGVSSNGQDAAGASAVDPDPPHGETENGSRPGGGGGGGGGGNGSDGGGSNIDPALRGLLERLPPSGTLLSKGRRQALINAFTACVNFIYAGDDDEPSAGP